MSHVHLLYRLTIITGEMYLRLTTHLNLKTIIMKLVIMIVIMIETVGELSTYFHSKCTFGENSHLCSLPAESFVCSSDV